MARELCGYYRLIRADRERLEALRADVYALVFERLDGELDGVCGGELAGKIAAAAARATWKALEPELLVSVGPLAEPIGHAATRACEDSGQ